MMVLVYDDTGVVEDTAVDTAVVEDTGSTAIDDGVSYTTGSTPLGAAKILGQDDSNARSDVVDAAAIASTTTGTILDAVHHASTADHHI